MFEDIWKIGSEFRQFRKKQCRVSVRELSLRSRVSATQIYKFERGESNMMVKTFARLVHALNHDFQLTCRKE